MTNTIQRPAHHRDAGSDRATTIWFRLCRSCCTRLADSDDDFRVDLIAEDAGIGEGLFERSIEMAFFAKRTRVESRSGQIDNVTVELKGCSIASSDVASPP